jgi:hypothetical protein
MDVSSIKPEIEGNAYPKAGDIVYVCDQQEGHQFKLGQEVQITKAKPQGDAYLCYSMDGLESWWLNSSEFERR